MIVSKLPITTSQKRYRKEFQQTAIGSVGDNKIMQWNCRGLSNKMRELLVFLNEKVFEIVYLNEVKNWQKENLTDN